MSDSLLPHGLQPARLLCPWDFPRQEHCSGLPFPSPRDLSDPRIKSMSPALAGGFLTPDPSGKSYLMLFFKTLPSHKLLIISSALLLGAAGAGERRGGTGWHSSWERWGQVCSRTFQTWWKRDYQINRLIWRSLWSLKINYLIENDLFESWDQTLKPEKSKPHSWWFWGFVLLKYNNVFEMRCYLIMIQLI